MRKMFSTKRSAMAVVFVLLLLRCSNNPSDSGGERQLRLLYFAAAPGAEAAGATLYSINEDGTDRMVLANEGLLVNSEARWAPDGSRIAFLSIRDGDQEIFVMNADGSDETNVTRNESDDFQPRWSPDGTALLFSSESAGGTSEIFRMDPNGSNLTQLTFMQNAGSADWSGDGSKVIFRVHGAIGAPSGVFIMNPDGSNIVQLLERERGQVVLSPDGNFLAFSRQIAAGEFHIYKLNIASGEEERLTESGLDTGPVWSPDGRKILFASSRDRILSQELYIMNADGSDEHRLTDLSDNEIGFSFSPDGERIAFYSGLMQNGSWDVYVMQADGSNLKRLTQDAANNTNPRWSPVRL